MGSEQFQFLGPAAISVSFDLNLMKIIPIDSARQDGLNEYNHGQVSRKIWFWVPPRKLKINLNSESFAPIFLEARFSKSARQDGSNEYNHD